MLPDILGDILPLTQGYICHKINHGGELKDTIKLLYEGSKTVLFEVTYNKYIRLCAKLNKTVKNY